VTTVSSLIAACCYAKIIFGIFGSMFMRVFEIASRDPQAVEPMFPVVKLSDIGTQTL
jgi:hypothetical protein